MAVASGPIGRITKARIDWVLIARFITIGCGSLITLGLVVLGLVIRHIDVQLMQDGITIPQRVDLGPGLAILGVIVAGLFLLFAWLTRYLVARVVFLCFDGLAILSALVQISAQLAVPPLIAVELIVDLGYGFVLVMSLISPRTGFGTKLA